MRRRWKHLGSTTALLLGLIVIPVAIRQFWPVCASLVARRQTDRARYRDVRFHNPTHGIDLAGMLFVPEGEGPFPAAVIIHGSGTSKRDNAWYLTLVAYLQQNGIVVLLPDKRGSEQSQGNWRTASFDDLAGDTVAAIDYLKTQDELAITRIGIVGMSQGGHIAPLVADRSPDVSYVVNVVGSAVPMREAILYEENHNLRQLGLLPGVSNAVSHLSSTYLVHVSQKDFWNAIGEYDPLPYWRRVEVPASRFTAVTIRT